MIKFSPKRAGGEIGKNHLLMKIYTYTVLKTCLFPSHGKGGVEPLLKCVAGLEYGGQEEVE